jgi:hypothetical protein
MNDVSTALIVVIVLFVAGFLAIRIFEDRFHGQKEFPQSYRKFFVGISECIKGPIASKWREWFPNSRKKFDRKELMSVLLGLDDDSLAELLTLYEKEFGTGAARYARQTHSKWKSGEVAPITQTFERFLLHLPKVMSFDLKCEVLRHLMVEYSAKDHHEITVYTDEWDEKLPALVRQLVIKPYTADLPREVETRLRWLADDETVLARQILKNSQIEQGRIAVSLLNEEMASIELLLAEKHLRAKIRHKLKFPCGTITLNIKRR